MAKIMGSPSKFGYMAITSGPIERLEDGRVSFTITVKMRRWHPGYWWFYWRMHFNVASKFSVPFWNWFPVALRRFLTGGENE